MPELPDITVYIEALEKRIQGQILEHVAIASPFLLRTALPPISDAEGRKVIYLRRLGKRICISLEDDLWLVIHLMVAGRLHWHDVLPANSGGSSRGVPNKSPRPKLSKSPKNRGLATFDFLHGTITLTEAGSQRRASLHVVEGEAGLRSLDPGGLEVLETDLAGFARVLQSANHTLKRALTDPRLFSGIGNAYSDEILFAARLSPIKLTQNLHLRRSKGSSRQRARLWWIGSNVYAQRQETDFRRRSQRFGWACQFTAGTRSRAFAVPPEFSASAMPPTRPTIVHHARLQGNFSRIAPFQDFYAPTGPKPPMNSTRSSEIRKLGEDRGSYQ